MLDFLSYLWFRVCSLDLNQPDLAEKTFFFSILFLALVQDIRLLSHDVVTLVLGHTVINKIKSSYLT